MFISSANALARRNPKTKSISCDPNFHPTFLFRRRIAWIRRLHPLRLRLLLTLFCVPRLSGFHPVIHLVLRLSKLSSEQLNALSLALSLVFSLLPSSHSTGTGGDTSYVLVASSPTSDTFCVSRDSGFPPAIHLVFCF